ncbi:MAG TPA: hypothetical protein VHM92_00590 [Allosphingosinicella sp.]|nr:hypothetical protein [Allosphingosinicella sp.]
MVRWYRLWLAALGASLAAAPADACSVELDYMQPSNFELVQIADAIVVATAVEEIGSKDERSVVFRIESSVKGAGPARHISSETGLGSVGRSDLGDLSKPHPEAFRGGCTRTTFRKGERYLLFLERDADGSWQDVGFPFTRVNEDYRGEADEWILAVRRYVRLQARLGPMEQLAALEAMLASKQDEDGRPLSEAALSDIRSHLAEASPWKPTPYLLDAYRRLERGELPGVSNSQVTEGGEAEALAELAMGKTRKPGASSVEEMRHFLRTALVIGDHPQAAPIFETILSSPDPKPEAIGLAIRFFAKNGQYPRAFQWIETKLMGMLPRLARDEAVELIVDVVAAQEGESGEGRAPWRGDAHAAGAWPELALSLFWYGKSVLGHDFGYSLSAAIRQIPYPDFRQRPSLTLALAQTQDDRVADWALAELSDEEKRALWDKTPIPYRGSLDESPAYLPLRVLLRTRGGRPKAQAQLIRFFCQSRERRHLLIATLGSQGDILDRGLLARIAATPSLTKEDRALLDGAIVQYLAREAARDGDKLHWHLAEYVEVLKRGREPYEKEAAKPIACPA